jgi:hypothetical protein
MSRIKAIYRGWAIPCSGKQVYGSRHRAEWLGKIQEPGVRRRAELYYQQLDALRTLRQQVRRDLLTESKKHKAWKRLCEIPAIGPIRAAELLGILQTPHRFRTKRQLWTYCGLGVVTRSSADHEVANGQLRQKKKQSRSEGSVQGGGGGGFDQAWPARRILCSSRVQRHAAGDGTATLARKIATIVLIVWKRGVCFDAQHLKPQTA